MDSMKTKNHLPWLFSPSSSQLIKSCGFISKIQSRIHLILSSPLRPLSPGEITILRNVPPPNREQSLRSCPLPTAVRGNFIQSRVCAVACPCPSPEWLLTARGIKSTTPHQGPTQARNWLALPASCATPPFTPSSHTGSLSPRVFTCADPSV